MSTASLLRTTLLLLGAATAYIAVSSSASAAVIITTDTKAPTENIYKANPLGVGSGNFTLYWRGQGNPDIVKTVGQGLSTFGAPTALNLSAVTFLIDAATPEVQGKGFQLTIYEMSTVNTHPSATNLVATHTGTLPDDMKKGDYLTLTLDAPQLLQPNKHYAFIVSFTGPTSTDSNAKSLSLATIGTGLANTDSSWRWIGYDGVYDNSASNSKNGLVFYAQAAAIPEPGTYALLGSAFLGLGFCLRFRNH